MCRWMRKGRVVRILVIDPDKAVRQRLLEQHHKHPEYPNVREKIYNARNIPEAEKKIAQVIGFELDIAVFSRSFPEAPRSRLREWLNW